MLQSPRFVPTVLRSLTCLLLVTAQASTAASDVPVPPESLILQVNRDQWHDEIPGQAKMIADLTRLNPDSHVERVMLASPDSRERIRNLSADRSIRSLVLTGEFNFSDDEVEKLLTSLRPRLANPFNLVILTPKTRLGDEMTAAVLAKRYSEAAGVDGILTIGTPHPYEPGFDKGNFPPTTRALVMAAGGVGGTIALQNWDQPLLINLVGMNSLVLSTMTMVACKVYRRWKARSSNTLSTPWVLLGPILAEVEWAGTNLALGGDRSLHANLAVTILGAAAGTWALDKFFQRSLARISEQVWHEMNQRYHLHQGWQIRVKGGKPVAIRLVSLNKPQRYLRCENELTVSGRDGNTK